MSDALERLAFLKLDDEDEISASTIAKVLQRNISRVRIYFKQGRIKGKLNTEKGLRGVLQAKVKDVRTFIETDFEHVKPGRAIGQEAGTRRFGSRRKSN